MLSAFRFVNNGIVAERTDIFQFGKGLSQYMERGQCDKHHTKMSELSVKSTRRKIQGIL
jgi:hypothetical protein